MADPRLTWVLADPHAGASAGADDALLRVLEAAAARAVDLLLMGDLFVAWLAPERFWTARQREVLEAIRAVRAAGGRARFVVGNRDYLVPTLEGTIFDEVFDGEVVTDVAGRPTLLCHGDGLNPEDWPYRAWRRTSRSLPARLLLRGLPGPAGRALAARTEARMAGMNTRYKTGVLPISALEALGRRARARGAQGALLGHFHHDRTLPVRDGAPVRIAPGFCDHERLLVAEAGGRLESVPAASLQ